MQNTADLHKPLSSLSTGLTILQKKGSQDPLIEGLAYDSRAVKPGYLFFTFDGLHTDGHLYIETAVAQGAPAVIHSKDLSHYHEGITYLRVTDTRAALSRVAAAFYDYPSHDLITIGVTGTDGKSTTVFLIYQLLSLLGEQTGFISTVNVNTNGCLEKNPFRQSTPEANEIQRMLYELKANYRLTAAGRRKTTYAVIEATSHGLSAKTSRLKDVFFNAGVLTNITHEHLEFHGSLEQYRQDKANLFRNLGKERKGVPDTGSPYFGVVNLDDPAHTLFRTATAFPVYSYSLENKAADVYASDLVPSLKGTRFTLHEGELAQEAWLPLPGLVNVANVLAAVLTVSKLLALPLSKLVPLLPRLKGVAGRMEIIDCGQPFQVIVDYAHTPGAFEKIFSLIRPLTERKLIVVFGSAGERDTQKRPLQGALAGRYADIVILTDEDPRGEDPMSILEAIACGCTGLTRDKDLFLIPERHLAIKKALSLAQTGDTVLCLGKGHEETIIYDGHKLAWNEIRAVKDLLEEMF